MSEYTPSMDRLKGAWVDQCAGVDPEMQGNEEWIRAQQATFDRWLAQVRREAKIEALREAADAALAVREAHCKIWPWPGSPEWSEAAHEYELTRVAFEQLRESPWGWIMDRADRMEAGE